MSEQHYAPPSADLSVSSNDIQMILEPLKASKGWMRYCSIIGMIAGILTLVVGVFTAITARSLAAQEQVSAAYNTGATFGSVLVYALISLIYFIPSIYLFRASSRVGIALDSQATIDISEALTLQKSFFKSAGISISILMLFMAIGIGAAILIPMMAGS